MRRVLPALALLTLLACSAKPEFIYEARPGAALESFRTIAFDPREMAWVLEGQRPVRNEAMKRLVQEALEARGYRLVEPEAADIWVDFVVMATSRQGAPRGAGRGEGGRGGHAEGGRGGRGGGGMPGGGMGPEGPGGAEVSQGPMRAEGFDPGGELTLRVQLLARSDAQTLWTASVHLPAQKRGEQPDRRAPLREVVRQLLNPLPRIRTATAH